jgi:hypothetical protein
MGNDNSIDIEPSSKENPSYKITNEPVYKGMDEVFEHTRKIIEGMDQGEKITVKDLADKVHSKVIEMPVGNVTNLVQMFVKRSKDVTVEIGRGGGVYKGGKPKRVDNRPRCPSCNQVVRSDHAKNKSIDKSAIEENA